MHRRHSLDVVHDGVRLGLFVEAAITPVLADVINLALGGKIVMLDHRPRGCHQTKSLRERPGGVYRQCAHFARGAKLEVTLRFIIRHVVKTADRKFDVRQRSAVDVGANLLRNGFNQRDGLLIQIAVRGVGTVFVHGSGFRVVRLLWSTLSSFFTVESRSSLLSARMSCRAMPMCGRYFSI